MTGDRKKLTEAERLSLIEKWESKPSPNPRYGGQTPADVAKKLLQPRKSKD